MTPHDRQLQFLSRWMPYGGCDEEILPEFGLTPKEFYRRLAQLLDKGVLAMDFTLRQRLREFCHVKIGQYSTGSPLR